MKNIAEVFEDERTYLWGVLYRMTGSGADADDLLMDAFERAMTRPPPDQTLPWRPWLTRVAVNLARDTLRKRRRRKYVGPWLPQAADTSHLPSPATPEARYGARESASYAFLKALEALTPNQRAVLVLREVFDYSTDETAQALDLSASNVKVTLHRARKAMKAYDDESPTLNPLEVQDALGRLMAALVAGDAEATARLLSQDVVATSDAGGEFKAALLPVYGAEKVVRFLLGVGNSTTLIDFELATVNGLPAIVTTVESTKKGVSPWVLMRVDVVEGAIVAVDLIIAESKRPAVSS